MPERLRRPESPFGIPGGIARSTLIALTEDAIRFGWYSLEDETLLRTFIPKLNIIMRDLRSDLTTYDRVIDGVMKLPVVVSGFRSKAESNELAAQQLQRAILLYEVNKMKMEKGIEIPWIPVSIFKSGQDDIFIRLGSHVPPQVAPIPRMDIHQIVAFIVARRLREIDPKIFRDNIEHIAANLRTLNTLCGTNHTLPSSLTGSFR